MSEAVERRLLRLLRHPTESPYGNPIPGLEELDGTATAVPRPSPAGSTVSLGDLRPGPDGRGAVVRRIGEPVQADPGLLSALRRAGVRPGAVVDVRPWPGGVTVGRGGRTARLAARTAAHVFVAPL